ncbi:MAG TPA: DUF4097 family beta strand repeat-containing protein [Candidatus Aquilonibacter sp.]|nr:DUF4097 family beta strand repeat-containing protein [Candidatus Aquilonibacter sp.]
MMIFPLVLAATIATQPVPSHATIAIDTTQANRWAGSRIEVDVWNRPDVVVDQEVVGGNPDDVRAVVKREGDRLSIVADYHGPQRSTFFGLIRLSNGSFRWVVHVPAGHSVSVSESNGRITINGVTAPLVAHTSNGTIDVHGAGPNVDARTSNGSVNVGITTLAGGPPRITLRSSNGHIDLSVPRGFATRVEAATANGRVTNPFANAAGAGSASARTSNGSIDITSGS